MTCPNSPCICPFEENILIIFQIRKKNEMNRKWYNRVIPSEVVRCMSAGTPDGSGVSCPALPPRATHQFAYTFWHVFSQEGECWHLSARSRSPSQSHERLTSEVIAGNWVPESAAIHHTALLQSRPFIVDFLKLIMLDAFLSSPLLTSHKSVLSVCSGR